MMVALVAALSLFTTIVAAEEIRPIRTVYDPLQRENVVVGEVSEEEFLMFIDSPLTLQIGGWKDRETAILAWEYTMQVHEEQEEEAMGDGEQSLADIVGFRTFFTGRNNELVNEMTPAELLGYLQDPQLREMSGVFSVKRNGGADEVIAKLERLVRGEEVEESIEEETVEEFTIEEPIEIIIDQPDEEIDEEMADEESEMEASQPDEEAIEIITGIECLRDESLTFTVTNPEEVELYLDQDALQVARDEGAEASGLFVFVNDRQVQTLAEVCGVEKLAPGESILCTAGDEFDFTMIGEENILAGYSLNAFSEVGFTC